MKKSVKKKLVSSGRTNADMLEDIEEVIDALQQRRADMLDQVYDADLEADDLWSSNERRWRRLEVKLRKAEAEADAPLNAPRSRNIDRLIQAIEEAYYELEQLLD